MLKTKNTADLHGANPLDRIRCLFSEHNQRMELCDVLHPRTEGCRHIYGMILSELTNITVLIEIAVITYGTGFDALWSYDDG